MSEPTTIDQTTQASHPGGIKTNTLKWLSSYPTWPLIWFMPLCAFVALAIFIHSATDLSKGGGEFPVIKIVEKNLKTANGETPQLGTRLVTVALYQQHPDDDGSMPRWRTFDPRPADCVTSDISAMQRVMSSLGPDEWQSLDDGLAKVPKPRMVGQYLITESGAIKEEED